MLLFLLSDGRTGSVPGAPVLWWSEYLLHFSSCPMSAAQSWLLPGCCQPEGGVVQKQPGQHGGSVTHLICSSLLVHSLEVNTPLEVLHCDMVSVRCWKSWFFYGTECWGLRWYLGAERSLSLYASGVRRSAAELRKEPELWAAAFGCSPCPPPSGFYLLWPGEGQMMTRADAFFNGSLGWVTQLPGSGFELSVWAGQSCLPAGLWAVSILPDLAGTRIYVLPGKTHPSFL